MWSAMQYPEISVLPKREMEDAPVHFDFFIQLFSNYIGHCSDQFLVLDSTGKLECDLHSFLHEVIRILHYIMLIGISGAYCRRFHLIAEVNAMPRNVHSSFNAGCMSGIF
ncbi:hypothetical protein Thermo_00403 [Thermoplasmatales archaeon]|nr:hypothetical protein Thermo_00403 [Thermoplasmatales archaeon]